MLQGTSRVIGDATAQFLARRPRLVEAIWAVATLLGAVTFWWVVTEYSQLSTWILAVIPGAWIGWGLAGATGVPGKVRWIAVLGVALQSGGFGHWRRFDTELARSTARAQDLSNAALQLGHMRAQIEQWNRYGPKTANPAEDAVTKPKQPALSTKPADPLPNNRPELVSDPQLARRVLSSFSIRWSIYWAGLPSRWLEWLACLATSGIAAGLALNLAAPRRAAPSR